MADELNKQEHPPSLYVHITSTGSLFISPPEGPEEWSSADKLREELIKLQKLNGICFFSVEATGANEPNPVIAEHVKLIESFDLRIIYQEDPHPAALSYYRSYSRHLHRAIRDAEIDVQGTAHIVARSEVILGNEQPGTAAFAEAEKSRDTWKAQLADAQNALRRLKDLDLELNPFVEGGEN